MPGGPSYEFAYAIIGVFECLLSISPISGPTSSTSLKDPGSIYSTLIQAHTILKAAFAAIAKYDRMLVNRLHLTSEKLVKRGGGVGEEEATNERCVPTTRFVAVKDEIYATNGKDNAKVFDAESSELISRYLRLISQGGRSDACILMYTHKSKVDMNNVLVRISLLRDNTIEGVDRLLEVLDEVFCIQRFLKITGRLSRIVFI